MKAHVWPIAVAVLAGAALVGGGWAAALGQEGPATRPARPDQHTIYIPYKDLEKVFEREGRGVYLPYEEFMRLWQKARGAAVPEEAPVDAFIASAAYTGAVKDDLATIDAVLQVQALKDGWSRVLVNLTGVAVSKATLGGQPARLVARADGGYDLLVAEKGTHQLDLSFVAKVQSQPGLKSFAFGAPKVPVSQIQLDIAEKDVKVEVQPLLAATRTPVGQDATRVMAFLGSTDSVRVQWQPRPMDVAKLTPLLFAVTDNHTALEEGVMRTRVTAAIDVVRAPVATFRLALPADVRLISIKTANLKDWTLTPETGRQVLAVDLHAGVTGAVTLSLQLERLIAADTTELVVPEVSLLDAQRETGHVAVSVAETLRSEVLEQTNLSQVDLRELPAALRAGDRVTGYRYLKHPATLRLAVKRVTPRIDVLAVNRVTIERDRVSLAAQLTYDVTRAGVFRLRAQVPAGYDVLAVGRPGSVRDWRLRPGADGQPVVIEIDLPQRTLGSFVLPVACERKRPPAEESVALPTAEALDVDKEEGYLAVLAPEALKVVTDQQAGLLPADLDELIRLGVPADDGRGNALLFGHRYRRRPITASVKVSPRQTKVTAEVLSLYRVARDVIRAQVTLRYTIQYAPLDTLFFQAPRSLADLVRVTGARLKEQKALPGPAGDAWVTWQAVLQRETTGRYDLTVEYDLPVPAAAAGGRPANVALPVLRIREADPRVERETGQLAVTKAADLAVEPEAKDLELIDARELDPALRRDDVVAAFKYYAAAYQLALNVARHEFAEIATTVATKATLESIVSKDGAVTARARWRVKTSRRQFLDVTMPEGSVLSGVAVDGAPVRPQKGQAPDAYLVRLGASAGGEREALVEIVYTTSPPASAAQVHLAAPDLPGDVPVQKLFWVLYVSDDRHVRRVTSDLNDETTWDFCWTSVAPTVRPVSLVDPDEWIDARSTSAATFEPPDDAQVFLLSGMGGGHAVTLRSGDRRLVGIVVFAVLAAIGLLFALARTAVKIAVVVVVVGAALLGATVNQTLILEGVSAGAYGLTAIVVIWALEFVFLRLPRSVRRRRAARSAAAPPPPAGPSAGPPSPPAPPGAPPARPTDGSRPAVPAEPAPAPPVDLARGGPEPFGPERTAEGPVEGPSAPPRPERGGTGPEVPGAPSTPRGTRPARAPANVPQASPPPAAAAPPTQARPPAGREESDEGPFLTDRDINRLVDEVLLKDRKEEDKEDQS